MKISHSNINQKKNGSSFITIKVNLWAKNIARNNNKVVKFFKKTRIKIDMHPITEHEINKAKVDKTANRNKLNCNYCHVIHHINNSLRK